MNFVPSTKDTNCNLLIVKKSSAKAKILHYNKSKAMNIAVMQQDNFIVISFLPNFNFIIIFDIL